MPSKNYIKSFGYALKGIGLFLKLETNARVHFVATIVVTLLGLFLKLETNEWLWIIFACALVILTEMLNTAIEKICDYLTMEKMKEIKTIKDISAGAVLVATLCAVIIGVIIFGPYLF